MHGDEAVHAVKFDELWHAGQYQYDPDEYHGPTLYYLTFPSVWLSGATDFAHTQAATYRLVPVVVGVVLILLLLLIGRGLGWPATACAAVLTAVSPAMVFYSRYYIQETLLVCFTLLVIAAGWRYVQSRRIGWVLLAGVGVGLMHATKETCVIVWGALVGALVVTLLWVRASHTADAHPALPPRRGGLWVALGAGVLAAVLVSVLLFSAGFTHLRGPLDSLRAYAIYFQRAGGGVHEHPWYYYLQMLGYTHYAPGPVFSEVLIVGLAVVGLIVIVRRRETSGLLRFVAVYTILLTAIYSAIPYKTPWCALGFLHGMILLAGHGAATLVAGCLSRTKLGMGRLALTAGVAVLLLAGTTQLAWQAWRGSQRFYADPRNPYVYAHPVRDVEHLTTQLTRLAAVSPDGPRMLIKIVVENCWPLPWYLRGFERVGYWEQPPDEPDADVVLVSYALQDALAPRLRDAYEVSYYGLRRDEILAVYVRRALWTTFVQSLTPATQPTVP